MKKRPQLTSLINLLGAAAIGKLLSMLARLVMVHTIKQEAMGLFSLINPLMILFINLAQIGLPIATSTLIAKKPQDSRKFFVTAFLIGIGISLILMMIIFFGAPIFASHALKNSDATLAIYGLGLLIPLITTSSILKGIYIGKGKVQYTTNSSIIEEIFRLAFLYFGISYFANVSPSMGALGAVVGMAVGEVGQTLYLFFIAPRNTKKHCFGWIFNKEYDSKIAAMELLKISLPSTGSRLIGSLAYFFEPIIYTQVLTKLGANNATMILEYGMLTGYVFPVLLMPGFFTTAISNYFLPELAKNIEKKDFNNGQKTFYKLISISLGLGLVFTLIMFFGADLLLKILYRDTSGAEFVRQLCFPFLIYYIETPCITACHALGRSKKTIVSTLFSSILRLVLLFFLLKPCGIYAVAISTLSGAMLDILLNFIDITSFFKRNNVKTGFKIKC